MTRTGLAARRSVLRASTARLLATAFLLSAGVCRAVDYEYDVLDRLTRVSYDNGAVVTYSYDPAGNLLEVRTTAGDSDGDGVRDDADNCTQIPNGPQRDSDDDGFGNRCDADLNNDGVVNVIDLGLFKQRFLTGDPHADFNGDGVVNVLDLGLLKSMFLTPPGPSALAAPGAAARSLTGDPPGVARAVAGPAPATARSDGPPGPDAPWLQHAFFDDDAESRNAPSWEICRLPVDASGVIVNGACEQSDGAGGAVDGTLAIDDAGWVTLGGAWVADVAFHELRADRARRLIAGVVDLGGGDAVDRGLVVSVRPGDGHRTSDLEGTWHAFSFSDAEGAASRPGWAMRRLRFDAWGRMTAGRSTRADGGETELQGEASVLPGGEVVPGGDWASRMAVSSLQLDARSTVVAGVATESLGEGQRPGLEVWVKEGEAPPQADLAGRWSVFGFWDADDGINEPGWARGEVEIDEDGTVIAGQLLDSLAVSLPATGSLQMGEAGRVALLGGLDAAFGDARLQLDAFGTVVAGVATRRDGPVRYPTLLVLVRTGP